MNLAEMFHGRVGLNTEEMAKLLNRQPQTLRVWASREEGAMRPIRVNGRLMWPLADAQRLLDREGVR